MPRQPRLRISGVPLHITQRGVNRCAIFVDDADRRHLYRLLCDATVEHGIAVHAYVFMGNHIHLLLTATDGDALPRAMRKVGQCYVQAFNYRHHRSGPLWQGRFKSCLVASEHYLMAVYRYIELNPVRAAMTRHPEQHRWSSVHANLGLIEDPLVTPHPRFTALGPDRDARATAWRDLLQQGIGQDDVDGIRAHLQQERALGDPRFQAMVESSLGRPVRVRPRGRPRRSQHQPDTP
ncbi:MAG TPA: transposase [Rhodanobacteraceae bacterium]|nr:transposase [Rhodanobacteraceae bacterium]